MHALLHEYDATTSTRAPSLKPVETASLRFKQPEKPVLVSTPDWTQVVLVPAADLSLKQRLFEATAQAKIWTSKVAMHLDPVARARFFKQIDRLHDADQWIGNDASLNLGSYKSFIRAVLKYKINSRPSLALMPNGNLMALWQQASDRMTIEFRPDDRARWLVTRNIAGAIERAAGETSLDRLNAVLAPYDGDKWFHGG